MNVSRLTIVRMIAILASIMIVLFALWEIAERTIMSGSSNSELAVFHLVRGISTGILMSFLAAWMMLRYRRRYEELLRAQSETSRKTREFFENIVRDAGEAVISLDKSGQVRSWNRAAEAIYGYTAEEMIGHTIHRLMPPDLLEEGEIEQLNEQMIKSGFVRNYETRRVRQDGATINVRISRSVLRDAQGNVAGYSAIVSDITTQKKIEQRLIHTEKLAAIGQAAASIAHEVRNALAGISGVVDVLKRSAAWKELPRGFGAEVDLQVGRIARIVNDLLSYARPGSLHTKEIDLHQVLDRVLNAAASHPDGAGKNVKLSYAEGALSVNADPARMEQAFSNLVNNAYQSMDSGGTLRISTCRDREAVQIRFEDTGNGMSEKTRQHAFDAFYTTRVRGTGLGLPIVATIVKAHKGRVRIEQTEGGGTVMTVVLPYSSANKHLGESVHVSA